MTMKLEQLLAILPVLVVAATAIILMLLIAIKRFHSATMLVSVAGLSAALASTIYVAKYVAMPAFFTPLFLIDNYALFYTGLALAATIVCVTLCHSYLQGYDGNREEMYLLLVLGVLGAVVLAYSSHLASFFLGLELMSVPMYGLVAYTFKNRRSLEAGMKYLILSAVGSACLLMGMAFMYAEVGNMHFAALQMGFLNPQGVSLLMWTATILLLVGISFKLSIVPFHLWTADVYEGAPAPVAAFLATVSKLAVFAVFVRFTYQSGLIHQPLFLELIAVLAAISIMVGNLLALAQNNFKRLLAYSSIAHFGYLLIPMVAHIGSTEVFTLYLLTYVVTSLGVFGVVSLMSSPYQGSDADSLHNYRGLFWRRPLLTAVLTSMLLSLAGIPLTAGFMGKFFVVLAGVNSHLWWLLGVLVVGSAIGLYYYLRAMITLFMPAPGMPLHDVEVNWSHHVGGVMVLAVTVAMFVIGIFPEPILQLLRHTLPAILQ
jgi:NADH-quinone oxidoreductase subunit N